MPFDRKEIKSKLPNRWVAAFLGVIYLARICHGIYMSIPGPTLLYLAGNVDANVKEISPIFLGRSGGMLIGAIIAAFLLQYGRPMATLGFAVFMSGIFMVLIPFVKTVGSLFYLITGAGVMAGYLDSGMQALLLRLWGEKDSRPLIQFFHFAFTIGASVAPLIVRPFLVQASQMRKDDVICPNSNTSAAQSTNASNSSLNNNVIPDNYFNPVGWAFIISAIYMITISLLFAWLACVNAENKIRRIRKSNDGEYETRPQPEFGKIWYIVLLICLFYFFMNGGEHPYVAYIYSIVVCVLGFTESDGSLLNSVFWSGMVAGRLIGTVVANFVMPRTIIIVCLMGCLVSMLLMCIFGHIPVVPWLVSFAYAFFISPLYPACVSWVSKFINVSGRYMFIFNLGNGAGSMSMTTVGGFIFQADPFSVIYFTMSLIICHCLTFGVMLLAEKYYMKTNTVKITTVEESVKVEAEETEFLTTT